VAFRMLPGSLAVLAESVFQAINRNGLKFPSQTSKKGKVTPGCLRSTAFPRGGPSSHSYGPSCQAGASNELLEASGHTPRIRRTSGQRQAFHSCCPSFFAATDTAVKTDGVTDCTDWDDTLTVEPGLLQINLGLLERPHALGRAS
jgi:hypothetical protein